MARRWTFKLPWIWPREQLHAVMTFRKCVDKEEDVPIWFNNNSLVSLQKAAIFHEERKVYPFNAPRGIYLWIDCNVVDEMIDG